MANPIPIAYWINYLGLFGLKDADIAALTNIFNTYIDPQVSVPIALAYIRGTQWYAKTFPDISTGIQFGLFTDEKGYRDYIVQLNEQYQLYTGQTASAVQIKNAINSGLPAISAVAQDAATFQGIKKGTQAGLFVGPGGYEAYVTELNANYQRYAGRPVTIDDIRAALDKKLTPAEVGKVLEGGAYASSYGPDVQYEAGAFGEGRLNPEELQTYSQQQVGLSSSTGLRIQNQINKALQRYQTIFSGSFGGPNFQLGGAGLAAPSLGTRAPATGQLTPDIAA